MEDAPQNAGSTAKGFELLEDLARLNRALRAIFAAGGRPGGLTDTELQLMYRCAASADGIAQRQLADALAISTAAVSALVENLRHRGLLEGQRPAHDRRRQVWKLTPRGRRVFDQVVSTLSPSLQALLIATPPAKGADLCQTVRQLRLAAESLPAPGDVPTDVIVKRGAA